MTVLTAKVASQSQNLQKFAVVYHIHKTANSVEGRDEGKKPAPRIIDVRAWIKGTRTRGRAMATQGYLEREREEREREREHTECEFTWRSEFITLMAAKKAAPPCQLPEGPCRPL